MRRIFTYALAALAVVALPTLTSCSPDNEEDDEPKNIDQAWVSTNEEYINIARTLTNDDGTPYYESVTAAWNSGATILMHYFNDRALTQGNLKPMLTSSVSVKYHGELVNGARFDSSYANSDSLFTTRLTSVVEGWVIALTQMHVGDSVRVVIPAAAGYGSTQTASIPAYSTLVFNIKLVDIPHYETL